MTDYNKQTVANLRQQLKDRGIPSTGLTRKAQIIEKLEEFDKRDEGDTGAEKVEEEPVPVPVRLEDTHLDQDDPDAERQHVLETPQAALEPVAQGEAAPVEAPTAVSHLATTDGSAITKATEPPNADVSTPVAIEALPVATVPEAAIDDPKSASPTIESEPPVADTKPADRTPSASSDEQPTVENTEIPLVGEPSVPSTAERSRLNTEELETESKKRKRRSQSPSVPSHEVQVKKSRPNSDVAPEVHLKEDGDVDTVMEQQQPEEEQNGDGRELIEKAVDDTNQSETKVCEADQASATDKTPISAPEPVKHPEASKKEKAPRYRELLQSGPEIVSKESITDDRPLVPALHAATPALYIRNLMRPLRPETLRNHLVSLASPPSTDSDTSIIETLFLDNMKTHAFVLFSSTTAASRVRSLLHGSTWPPEANRKDLWVDFVPDDRVKAWIEEEENAITAEKASRSAGRPSLAKKFEVIYSTEGDGTVKAVLQEVGAPGPWTPTNVPRRESQASAPPAGSKAAPTRETRQDIERSFKTLEELFCSTTAKPRLYYLPVSDAISDERRRDLDRETSRDWAPEEKRRGRGMQWSHMDQKVRFGFDKDNRVVEVGHDFGPWSDSRGGGFRGGGGGGGGGGGRRGSGNRGFYRGDGGWRSGP